MSDKKAPPNDPPKGTESKPNAPGNKPKPPPARPHMINDHAIKAVKKNQTRLNEG